MSSSQSGAGAPDDRQPLTRFMRRASRVLSGKNRASTSAPEPPQSSASSRTAPPPPPPSQPQPTALQPKVVRVSESTIPIRVHTSMNPSNALLEERARALFAKYGLTLEPGEWTAPVRGTQERVEKKVRMRVHRQCHRCSTTFGSEKICISCQHTRCKKCPRYPTKKRKEDGGMLLKPGTGAEPPRPRILRTKSLIGIAQAGENDLVRKKPTQRVRRICHKCNTMFAGKATQCNSCNHLRCAACPRDPPKTNKYPDGYPGDAPETFPLAIRHHKSIRTRIRWRCHNCSTVFKEHETSCHRCQHARCDSCTREPPKRAVKGIDDDGSVMKRLEERMGGLGVGESSARG